MKVLLTCTECNYAEVSSADKVLMNKIIIWNHVKKAHSGVEGVMRTYQLAPNHFYETRAGELRTA